MTTQTEALRMALEAMKSFQDGTNGLYEGEFEEEIRACEEALAQPEQEPVAWIIEYEVCAGGMNRGSSLTKFDYVWHECSFVSEDKDAEIDATKWRNRKETPLYTTPPQPKESEQEPPVVAELLCVCGAEWEWRNRDWELVSTPPQRTAAVGEDIKLKPLTDEQIEAMWPLRPTDSVIQFARAIEAAHGIGEKK
jgi:hypothetical protein